MTHSSGRTPSSVVAQYAGLGVDVAYQQCYYRMFQDGWTAEAIDQDLQVPEGSWDFYTALQGWVPMDGVEGTYASISYIRIPLNCEGDCSGCCGEEGSQWADMEDVLPEHKAIANIMCQTFYRVCTGG